MNLYATNKDDKSDPIHQPFDQWLTLQSIERAKKYMPDDLEMTLVCALLPSDMQILTPELIPQCDRRILLEQSTKIEYGKAMPWETREIEKDVARYFSKRELPFYQEVIEAGISVAREDEDEDEEDFYVMLTNADIGLTKYFYNFILGIMREKRQAFVINRVTLPVEKTLPSRKYINGTRITGKFLPDESIFNHTIKKPTTDKTDIETLMGEIDASVEHGLEHPGTDCFVMHSSIVDQVYMGKQFPAYAPIACSLKTILTEILAKDTFARIPSNKDGTFHVGDDRNWKQEEEANITQYITRRRKKDISDSPCKQKNWKNPYTLMNLANSGRAFSERYPEYVAEMKEKRKRRQKKI